MVKKLTKNRIYYYRCEGCNFIYKEKLIAKKCEEWCREHKSCNIDITKHAINLNKT